MFKSLKSKFKSFTESAKLAKECYSLLQDIRKNPSSPQAKEAGSHFLWLIKELYAQYKNEGLKSLADAQFLEHLLSYPNNESAFKNKVEQDNILQHRNGELQVNTSPGSQTENFQPIDSFGKNLLTQLEKGLMTHKKSEE